MTLTNTDLMYLITRANKLGAQGYRIVDIQIPNKATSCIKDTAFFTDVPIMRSATSRPWYES